jgi:hypothetical protein
MATATFDAVMRSRIAAFQEAHGLLADGTAGAKTWAKLVEPAGEQPATEVASTTETTEQAHELVTPETFPLLAKFIQLEPTEEAVKAFLAAECGVDIDAVLAGVDAALAEATTAT